MSRTVTDGPTKCAWAPDGSNAGSDPHPHLAGSGFGEEAKVLPNILSHVGHTPLVRLNRIPQSMGVKCEVLAKCEFFNAGGSVKDRIAVRMVEDAEKSGRIKPGDTLIEPTSGNTGIGLSLAAAVKGYKMIITLPEKMSREKVDVLRGLGAEIIRTPTEAAWDAPESHIGVAKRLQAQLENAHILDQYANPANPLAHYDGTAEEILEQTDGKVDMFVAGAGTGGTLTGTARKLRERIPDIKVVGIDPVGSILAQPETLNVAGGSYQVEGIGYDFIPIACDRDPRLVNKWIKSSDKDSFIMARRLIREEGLLCGGSSGTAVAYAIQAILEDDEINQEGKTVVVILPDGVRNYMTKFLSDDWMIEQGFLEAGQPHKSKQREEEWGEGTVADLKPPKAQTCPSKTSISDAIEKMNHGGFDNLPVVGADGHMVGWVTVGSLLSKLAKKGDSALSPQDPVEKAMFHFQRGQSFQEVTLETKLSALQDFFDVNHVAFVTEQGNPHKLVGVITKVDVLRYLVANKA